MNSPNNTINLRTGKKLKTLDIIWGCGHPPDIVESIFSYNYCLKTSRQLCKSSELNKLGLEIISWHEPVFYDQICRCLIDNQLNADSLLIVANPELVISPEAVKKMVKTLEGSSAGAVLPVFNETANPVQAANLPAIYLNLSTYLEVADLMPNETPPILASGDLDCSCVLIHRDFVQNFILFVNNKEPFKSIKQPCKNSSDSLQNSKTFLHNSEISFQDVLTAFVCSLVSQNLCLIDTTALIHSFGRYYGGQREDLVSLVPESASNVLDVGCAKGGFGELMKTKRPDIHITGVEMNSVMADIASLHYDKIYNMKIEDVNFKTEFDHINCGDIIEHLYEPWQMIKLFHSLLKKDGSLVISIPNAGHWTIVNDLAQGRFQYLPVGLLCLTHIRWFTEESIKEALYDAGFEIELFVREQIPPTPKGVSFLKLLCQNGMGDRTSLLTN
ncbi:MAG: class I SAM-dependent methyltransferase, partial [Desulfamplus sp.]|nr:class I SAM-dependent methyltransferase [Desulfamplus sp.]